MRHLSLWYAWRPAIFSAVHFSQRQLGAQIPLPPSSSSSSKTECELLERITIQLKSLQRTNGEVVPVSFLASSLDGDTQEHVSDEFGGLANFLRQRSSAFFLENKGGVLLVRPHVELKRSSTVAAQPSRKNLPTVDLDDVVTYCDVFRLARHLTCDAFTPTDSIPSGLLQKPLVDVVQSQPSRFEWKSSAASGAPSLRYVLPSSVRDALQVRNELDKMSMEELDKEREKLKNIPPLKRAKFRRRIVKASLRKRFPLGTPFLDPPVTAMLLFDVLPDVPVINSEIPQLLPNGGHDGCPFDRKFFLRFPNLFAVEELAQMATFSILRRDVAGLCTPPSGAPSKHEAVAELLSRLIDIGKDADGGGAVIVKHKSSLHCFCSRPVYKKLLELGIDNVLQEYPQVFSPCFSGGSAESAASDGKMPFSLSAADSNPFLMAERVTIDLVAAREAMNLIGTEIGSMSSLP